MTRLAGLGRRCGTSSDPKNRQFALTTSAASQRRQRMSTVNVAVGIGIPNLMETLEEFELFAGGGAIAKTVSKFQAQPM